MLQYIYDGASVMKGSVTGLQQQFFNHIPYHYSHTLLSSFHGSVVLHKLVVGIN